MIIYGKILQGNSSEVLDKLLILNGSSGGARPKIVALVSKDKQTLIHGNLTQENYEPYYNFMLSSLNRSLKMMIALLDVNQKEPSKDMLTNS